jgi:hypothetical protein
LKPRRERTTNSDRAANLTLKWRWSNQWWAAVVALGKLWLKAEATLIGNLFVRLPTFPAYSPLANNNAGGVHRIELTGVYDASVSSWGNYGLVYGDLAMSQNEWYTKNLKENGNGSRTCRAAFKFTPPMPRQDYAMRKRRMR